MTRLLILFFISFLYGSTYAQKSNGTPGMRMQRDKVVLKNKDAETGRIIYCDSNKIVLQKFDFSEKNILRKDIDTIIGLSYFTYFLSPSIGTVHWSGLVNQRLDTFTRDAMNLGVKFGYMRKKHFAANMEMDYQGGHGHQIWRMGGGIRRYCFSNYVQDENFYFGVNLGYNFVFTNMNNFFDLGWCIGYEYFLKEKYRLFVEYDRLIEQKYSPHPAGYSFNAGIRFSIEYSNYYKKFNR